MTAALSAAALAALIIPWSSTVYVPAQIEARDMTRVFPPRAGRIISVHAAAGQTVAAGDRLVLLDAPDIVHELLLTQTRIAAVRARLNRRGADDADKEDNQVLESEFRSLTLRLQGLQKEQGELDIRATRGGRIVEFNPQLHPGRWIGPKEPVAMIIEGEAVNAVGYIGESDLWRVLPGATGRFVPDDATGPAASLTLASVAIAGAGAIEHPDLTQLHGGRVAVQPDSRQRLVPTVAQYLAMMHVSSDWHPPPMTRRGLVLLEGQRESLISRGWRQVLKVLVRESST